MLELKEAKKQLAETLSKFFAVTSDDATDEQMYKAVVLIVRDMMIKKKNDFNTRVKQQKAKRVYYLCMEFLLGRMLRNNLYNLGIEKVIRDTLRSFHHDLDKLYELEADPGLGNGGLGRLAACFMDSLSTGAYPALGFSLRYEFGLFKQRIVDGAQVELPDNWLGTGELWLLPRSDKTFKVSMGGWLEERWENGRHIVINRDAEVFEAVPYDMMIPGYDSEAVSVLRLWKARSAYEFNMRTFSEGGYLEAMRRETEAELLTKVLYPTDEHNAGKILRLSQQYFLVSASLQNIIKDHLRVYPDLSNLADKVAIHINDTHPALAVPELMRILLDDFGFGWEEAFSATHKVIAYTNHTVMAEALEKWGDDLIQTRLPRIYQLIKEIDRRFIDDALVRFGGDTEKVERMRIINNRTVRMANLSVLGSHSVNGVSALHSDIIKSSVFKDFYDYTPSKFTNVTNGIAFRRWLNQSNPMLAAFIESLIGEKYKKDADELLRLREFVNDDAALTALSNIKYKNKIRFADFAKKQGVTLDPDTRFDVQIKRLHEYKRQLMNVLRIISLYIDVSDGNQIQPQTFIFGAKAAPSYYHAKRIISLINAVAKTIADDPIARQYITVYFVENYNVTVAESLLPASEVSQQISLAGKEASGTSNMKFMLNGAITMGTLDGANVEIGESVGPDNIFIFGMTSAEVEELWKSGYYATYFYSKNEKLMRAVDFIKHGMGGAFADIAAYLTTSSHPDPYMCMVDYADYMRAHKDLCERFEDKKHWNRMALLNIAEAGRFSSDRCIREYSDNIWGIKQLK